MVMARDDCNRIADELADYLCHESSTDNNNNGGGASLSEAEVIRRHALEQLVESALGVDVTAAAQRLVAADDAGDKEKEEGFRNAANVLMDSPSFRMMSGAVEECSSRLPPSVTTADKEIASDVMATSSNSKKAKIPAPAATSFSLFDMMDAQKAKTPQVSAAAPAPTSFSLFDMLDSQKGSGGFDLPPRIMAYQVIERYQLEKNNYTIGTGTIKKDTGEESTTIELLEKADDMEDLSPDPDSWEDIRNILYGGMMNPIAVHEQTRYLKVHESLIEKCRGNNACSSQFWGLAQNLVGAILTLSAQSREKHSTDYLCWDIAQSLIKTLSHLAEDYVMSAVGNEREIERMLLGLCMIESSDLPACIFGMMEPMAGWFEIWARFVDPPRFMTIIHASGLGGAVMRRCESSGRNISSEIIARAAQMSRDGAGAGSTSLADIHHCNFVQSLSILRTVLFRCGGSPEILSLIHKQYSNESNNGSLLLPSFLSTTGVASSDDVQILLKGVEESRKQEWDQSQHLGVHGARNSVLKPFQDVLLANGSSHRQVVSDLEHMCTQTIQLIQQS